MSSANLPTILLGISLLILPGFFLLEKYENSTWKSRLLWPSLQAQTNLHTPIHTNGTYLTSRITENRTLGPSDNPVILSSPTTIPDDVTLTIDPGTHIYALEHGALIVDGLLKLQGTAANPISFSTNEDHPSNRTWSGIMITNSGQVTGQQTTIAYAHPAISCLGDATANLSALSISQTNVGLYNESTACRLTQSRIQARQTGIISTIKNPAVSNLTIQAPQEIKTISTD